MNNEGQNTRLASNRTQRTRADVATIAERTPNRVRQRKPIPALPECYNKKKAIPFNLEDQSCDDFLRITFPKMEPILGKWLEPQSLSMIYGPRGGGKTYLALSIAYAISTGRDLFDWKVASPKKVVYLDGEMAAHALQARLRKMVRSNENVNPREMLRIVTPDLQKGILPDIATIEGQRMINCAIHPDTDVIIVDNLSSWSKAGGEDAETWAPIAAWALKLRSEGKTVIFIHHAGKSGAQRGTSRREDHLDTVIALRRPPQSKPSDGAYFELHFEKSRNQTGTDVEPFFAQLFDDDDGNQRWDWGPIALPVDARKMEAKEMEGRNMSRAAIAKHFGVNPSTITRWLNEK